MQGEPSTAIADAVAVNSSELIYPNPFSGEATIVINDARFKNYDLYVYDISGKEVAYLKNQTQRTTISRNNLEGGVYFYKAMSKDNHSLTGKFVVE